VSAHLEPADAEPDALAREDVFVAMRHCQVAPVHYDGQEDGVVGGGDGTGYGLNGGRHLKQTENHNDKYLLICKKCERNKVSKRPKLWVVYKVHRSYNICLWFRQCQPMPTKTETEKGRINSYIIKNKAFRRLLRSRPKAKIIFFRHGGKSHAGKNLNTFQTWS
jgi:hypothetical protein